MEFLSLLKLPKEPNLYHKRLYIIFLNVQYICGETYGPVRNVALPIIVPSFFIIGIVLLRYHFQIFTSVCNSIRWHNHVSFVSFLSKQDRSSHCKDVSKCDFFFLCYSCTCIIILLTLALPNVPSPMYKYLEVSFPN